MTLVDSSIWVDYFRNANAAGSRGLTRIVDQNEDIAILPIILTEVLMGFREERSFRTAHHVLTLVPKLPIPDRSFVEAANLFRFLRQKGVTIRGAIDCLIAQSCIDSSATLLTLDKDFRNIAKYTALKLCIPT